jgi:hypothetical protein
VFGCQQVLELLSQCVIVFYVVIMSLTNGVLFIWIGSPNGTRWTGSVAAAAYSLIRETEYSVETLVISQIAPRTLQ